MSKSSITTLTQQSNAKILYLDILSYLPKCISLYEEYLNMLLLYKIHPPLVDIHYFNTLSNIFNTIFIKLNTNTKALIEDYDIIKYKEFILLNEDKILIELFNYCINADIKEYFNNLTNVIVFFDGTPNSNEIITKINNNYLYNIKKYMNHVLLDIINNDKETYLGLFNSHKIYFNSNKLNYTSTFVQLLKLNINLNIKYEIYSNNVNSAIYNIYNVIKNNANMDIVIISKSCNLFISLLLYGFNKKTLFVYYENNNLYSLIIDRLIEEIHLDKTFNIQSIVLDLGYIFSINSNQLLPSSFTFDFNLTDEFHKFMVLYFQICKKHKIKSLIYDNKIDIKHLILLLKEYENYKLNKKTINEYVKNITFTSKTNKSLIDSLTLNDKLTIEKPHEYISRSILTFVEYLHLIQDEIKNIDESYLEYLKNTKINEDENELYELMIQINEDEKKRLILTFDSYDRILMQVSPNKSISQNIDDVDFNRNTKESYYEHYFKNNIVYHRNKYYEEHYDKTKTEFNKIDGNGYVVINSLRVLNKIEYLMIRLGLNPYTKFNIKLSTLSYDTIKTIPMIFYEKLKDFTQMPFYIENIIQKKPEFIYDIHSFIIFYYLSYIIHDTFPQLKINILTKQIKHDDISGLITLEKNNYDTIDYLNNSNFRLIADYEFNKLKTLEYLIEPSTLKLNKNEYNNIVKQLLRKCIDYNNNTIIKLIYKYTNDMKKIISCEYIHALKWLYEYYFIFNNFSISKWRYRFNTTPLISFIDEDIEIYDDYKFKVDDIEYYYEPDKINLHATFKKTDYLTDDLIADLILHMTYEYKNNKSLKLEIPTGDDAEHTLMDIAENIIKKKIKDKKIDLINVLYLTKQYINALLPYVVKVI
jgi:hypothetical protein